MIDRIGPGDAAKGEELSRLIRLLFAQQQLIDYLLETRDQAMPALTPEGIDLFKARAAYERQVVEHYLSLTGGNVKRTARLLGVKSHTTLQGVIARLGIDRELLRHRVGRPLAEERSA